MVKLYVQNLMAYGYEALIGVVFGELLWPVMPIF